MDGFLADRLQIYKAGGSIRFWQSGPDQKGILDLSIPAVQFYDETIPQLLPMA
jgi:hypothetical protein